MSDNVPLPAAAGKAAADEVTYSGNNDAQVQLMRFVGVTGAEGSKTVIEEPQIGSITEAAPASDTASSGLNGRLQRIAQRLTALFPAALGGGGGLKVEGDVAHDVADAGNPVLNGATSIAHGTNPTANTAGRRTKLYANRAGILYVIGGHPNPVSYGMSITTAVTNAIIGPTVGAGLKFVCTGLTVTLDNASTVFPSCVVGFGTASAPAFATTPGTAKILGGHPGMPAGGGFNVGDGSGIIGVGADDEEVRITTVGIAGGNGIYVLLKGYTIES